MARLGYKEIFVVEIRQLSGDWPIVPRKISFEKLEVIDQEIKLYNKYGLAFWVHSDYQERFVEEGIFDNEKEANEYYITCMKKCIETEELFLARRKRELEEFEKCFH